MTAFVSELTLPNLIPYNNNGKWGYCNKDNKIIIDCIYDEAEPFYEGLALVKTEGSFFILMIKERMFYKQNLIIYFHSQRDCQQLF